MWFYLLFNKTNYAWVKILTTEVNCTQQLTLYPNTNTNFPHSTGYSPCTCSIVAEQGRIILRASNSKMARKFGSRCDKNNPIKFLKNSLDNGHVMNNQDHIVMANRLSNIRCWVWLNWVLQNMKYSIVGAVGLNAHNHGHSLLHEWMRTNATLWFLLSQSF